MNRVIKKPYTLAFLSVGRIDLTSIFSNAEPNAGIFRLRQTFQRDEFGRLSKEHTIILNSAVGSFFLMSVVGGVYSSAETWQKMKDSNLASKMHDHISAKRKMRSYITANFLRSALIWGIKGAVITSVFTSSYIMISLYRGKSTLWEYLIGGFLIGSASKIKYRLRGIIFGGTSGLICGAIIGGIHLASMTLSCSRVQDLLKMEHLGTIMENISEEKKQQLRKLTQLETNRIIRSKNSKTESEPTEEAKK